MITIEVHNFYSKQAEDVRVYNDLPENEKDALDEMVLAKGKEQDFTICTLSMSINRKCLITDLIRPFVGKDGYIRNDAWNVVHNINGYEVRFINKAFIPKTSKQTIDMSNLTYIPKYLVKELCELGMPLYRYDVIPDMCHIDYDTKDVPSIKYERSNNFRIPTYGEVIDWFSSKGIHITFDAFFTRSLDGNVGYLWKISFIDESNGDVKLKTISEEDTWDGKEGYGGSFELDAQSAIRYAIDLKKILDI